MSGKVSKTAAMTFPISALPTARPPLVWFSKTESTVCIARMASISWEFQAAL